MRRLTNRSPGLRRLSSHQIILCLVVLVALALRFNGLNWDSGYGFHPDERSIYMRAGCMYDLLTERPGYHNCLAEHPQIEAGLPGIRTLVDFERSPLNPHWFPLGSVLIYVLVFFRSVIELFTDVNALDMRYVGRSLSALADVGTVLLVYVLGRRMYGLLYGPWVGLLAATLVAFAVIHVQHSHFYRPETFTAVLVLAVFWAMLQVLERRRLRDSLVLGALVGLAFTPKVSILPLAIPLGLAYFYRLLDSGAGRLSGLPRPAIEQTFLHSVAALAVALFVFFLVTPYALLNLSNFLSEQAAQTGMARSAGLWPFTIQYVGTPAFLYQFKQTAVWGLGPLLGITAWLSILFTIFMAWQGNFARRADILVLAWLIPSILFLETFEVRFQRYYFALIPFMVLTGSRMLLWTPFFLRSRVGGGRGIVAIGQGRQRASSAANRIVGYWNFLRYNPAGQQYAVFASWGLVAVVLASTILYSLAFQRVYLQSHPAVSASEWLNGTIPTGARIISDNHWDEFIPELYDYRVWQFPAYEPDNVAKLAELGDRLSTSEYLVFYSQRPYVSVTSDPERFPLTAGYYRLLFAGDLGYELVREFTTHPSFLGVTIKDDSFERSELPRPGSPGAEGASGITFNWGYADDNVVGYDHPTVLVFRNVEKLPAESLVLTLAGTPAPESTALKFSESDWERQKEGGTWSELFDRWGTANRVPVLAWLLVVELIALIAFPLSYFVFRPLADRGIVLARLLGLLAVAYATWLVVNLNFMEFSVAAMLLGLLAVAGLSGAVLIGLRREIIEFVRHRWRLLVTGEIIFLAAFFAFVVIRALNPDLWHPYRGGEKPMELAYFNALLRSTISPPYDPWFAGGYLNYYYWGYFILAIPTRLAGIVPTVAFNLAVPLLFALTASGAFSIVYNLAEGVRRSRRPSRSTMTHVTDVEADAEYAGDYKENPLQEFSRTETAIRSPVTAGITAALFVGFIGNLDGLIQLGQGVWGRLQGTGASILAFDFWRSSRMLPNQESIDPGPLTFWLWGKGDLPPEVSWHITEFPYFSFLFADLHAHMMAIPFTILVIALGLNVAVGLKQLSIVWGVSALAMLAVAVGALWPINSWDYPSYLVLCLALVGLAAYGAWSSPKAAIAGGACIGISVAILSVIAFYPFHQSVETFGTGIEATRWKTPLANFIGIHGLFLFIIGSFLAWQSRRALYLVVGQRLGVRYLDAAVATGAHRRAHQGRLRLLAGIGLLAAAFFAVQGFATAGVLCVFLALTGLALWDTLTSSGRGKEYSAFPLVLTGLGIGLAIGVDLVRVEDDIGRMNTLFKYYLGVWVLFGLSAAYFLWRMWYDHEFRPVKFNGLRYLWLGVVGALILSSLIYTALGTQARIADRFHPLPATLDGTAYMLEAVHREKEQPIELKWDLEAIQWLQDHAQGSPVILEAHTEQYRWGGRMSIYTGLPTVLGWPWHQIQQRGPYSGEVHVRAKDVEQIYTTENVQQARELLDRYDVTYVVVGDLERVFYPGEGLGKFDIMAQQNTAARVFDNGHTAIYEIRPLTTSIP